MLRNRRSADDPLVTPVRTRSRSRTAARNRPVFLIEAYVPAGDAGSRAADELLGLIRALPDVEIVGTVVIPNDEWLLCLVEAPSADVVEPIQAAGQGNVRFVEVEWRPSRET
jgi:hypothetical protein